MVILRVLIVFIPGSSDIYQVPGKRSTLGEGTW